MRISKHFIDRLKERTMYSDTETFLTDIQKIFCAYILCITYVTFVQRCSSACICHISDFCTPVSTVWVQLLLILVSTTEISSFFITDRILKFIPFFTILCSLQLVKSFFIPPPSPPSDPPPPSHPSSASHRARISLPLVLTLVIPDRVVTFSQSTWVERRVARSRTRTFVALGPACC